MRTSEEVRDLVTQLEDGWSAIRTQMIKYEDQTYCTAAYRNDLVASLAPEITTRVSYPSRFIDHDGNAIAGILKTLLQYHVEPEPGKRKETTADELELYFAHVGAKHIEPLREQTNRMRAVQPFAVWWLDLLEPPEEADERFDPLRLSLLHPRTVSALFDDNFKPTIVARHFKLPYVKVVETYGRKGKKDESPLEICRTQFEFLRGGRGQAVEQADLYSKSAEVWIIADSLMYSHYISIDVGEDGKAQYRQVGQDKDGKVVDYPNPWGRPPMFFIWGRLNADAQNLENQLEPVLAAEMRHQRNVDTIQSHAASIALTPAKHALELPAEAQVQLEDKPLPGLEIKEGEITRGVGTFTRLENPLDVSVRDLISLWTQDRDATRPPSVLLGGEAVLTSVSTAAAYLGGVRSANMLYDACRKYETEAIKDVAMAIRYWMTKVRNKPGQKESAREAIYFTPTGEERRQGKALPEKVEHELGPEDFDGEWTLEIKRAADTVPEIQANYMLKRQEVEDGVATPEDLMEVVTEDVAGTKKKQELWRRYQTVGPVIDAFDLIDSVRAIALKGGRNGGPGPDYSALLAQSGLLVALPGQAPPAQGGGGNGSSLGQVTYTPPAVAEREVQSVG